MLGRGGQKTHIFVHLPGLISWTEFYQVGRRWTYPVFSVYVQRRALRDSCFVGPVSQVGVGLRSRSLNVRSPWSQAIEEATIPGPQSRCGPGL